MVEETQAGGAAGAKAWRQGTVWPPGDPQSHPCLSYLGTCLASQVRLPCHPRGLPPAGDPRDGPEQF